MKTLLILMTSAIIGGSSMQGYTLDISITNLKKAEGTLYLELMNEKGEEVGQYKKEITEKTCVLVLENIQPGTYAIRYYHDENNNGEMDTGMFGKPEEGYGYSNDARGFMGPADLEDQLFEVHENLKITLTTVQ